MGAFQRAEQPILPGGKAMEKLAISAFATVGLMAVATTVLTLMAPV
jgi:hypothetical protein